MEGAGGSAGAVAIACGHHAPRDESGTANERRLAQRFPLAEREGHTDATKKPLRGSYRNGFDLCEQVFADLVDGKLPGSDELLAGSDQGAKSFGQKLGVEWLLKRFVDRGTIEAHRAAVVGQQGDQDRFPEIGILAQVLADL